MGSECHSFVSWLWWTARGLLGDGGDVERRGILRAVAGRAATWLVVPGMLVTLLAVAGPAGAVGPGRDTDLVLDFDTLPSPTDPVDGVVATGDGLRLVPGVAGRGRAVQFPGADRPPAAVVVAGDAVPWPGRAPFTLAADVRLDAVADEDGDNVVQRGLWGDGAQLKLQVDYGRPSCVVRGRSGQVVVRIARDLVPGVWYGLQCHREADLVALVVRRADTGETWRAVGTGEIGAVVGPPDVPMSVGGKVGRSGALVEGPDPLAGAVDAVALRVERAPGR